MTTIEHNGKTYRLEDPAQLMGERGCRPYQATTALSDDGERVQVVWEFYDDVLEFNDETGEWDIKCNFDEDSYDLDTYPSDITPWDEYTVRAY